MENNLENGSASTVVERNLRNVNFSGAVGRIAFNGDREVVTEVDVLEKCTSEEILRALDGAFLLQYRFEPNPNSYNLGFRTNLQRIFHGTATSSWNIAEPTC